jgi:hypothetical protein
MSHTAVYDAASNRMIVFAGNPHYGSCYQTTNDTWVLENANGQGGTPNWIQLSPTGGPPSSRYNHTAVYDAATNRMIVFGGVQTCGAYRDDVWVLEHANGLDIATGLPTTPNWVQLNPRLAIGAHSAVYDEVSNRMIVFGGVPPAGQVNDVWVLENANGLGGTPNWTQLIPTGGPPHARGNHTAVYDAATNRMTVFGGHLPVSNDIWVLENANGLGGTPNWVQLNPAPDPVSGRPPERCLHTAVYNPATNRMVIFAGRKACELPAPFDDVWVLTNANGIVDTAAPVAECCTDPATLWPPNHKMVEVDVFVTAEDDITPPENLSLEAIFVSSDEPDDYIADGDAPGDVNGEDGFTAPVEVTDAFTDSFVADGKRVFTGTIALRAERSGIGVGRTYTIEAFVSDEAGNVGSSTCEVVVPHDNGNKKK